MDREHRLAENEILFREVNERIRELRSDSWESHEMQFMCECGDPACTTVLRMTPAEYEELRSNSARFAVLPGHQIEDIENVVETNPRYLVVEKHLETLERVQKADPRS